MWVLINPSVVFQDPNGMFVTGKGGRLGGASDRNDNWPPEDRCGSFDGDMV
jgi:hypothetical protein